MPITLTEVEKQHELSGNQESKIRSKVKKQLSEAKSKELSGSNIFGPPIEVPPRSSKVARSLQPEESKDMGEPAPRVVHTSVKVSNVSCLLRLVSVSNFSLQPRLHHSPIPTHLLSLFPLSSFSNRVEDSM